ncbi:MAG: HEAT repeat domain-containing protein, partial [Gemmataceae bacterium]|nr:HEAT repeat domain-containing protein [Gemmataceae bacterium]
ALILVLLEWGANAERRAEIERSLALRAQDPRVAGVCGYLRYRWSGRRLLPADEYTPEDPASRCQFWDWDAAVLARNLERMGESGRRQALDVMPFLLAHADERVRGHAVEVLRLWGESRHLAASLLVLDDLRGGTGESVTRLLGALDLDRAESAARLILALPAASPAQLVWALDQAGVSFPPEEEQPALTARFGRVDQPTSVRAGLARLAGRWHHPDAETWLHAALNDNDPEVQVEALRGLNQRPGMAADAGTLSRLLASPVAAVRVEAARVAARQGDRTVIEALIADPDVSVRVFLAECLAAHDEMKPLAARLQADSHPQVRAAALTVDRAAELAREPERETSWHVLARAARLARVPFWKLAPEPQWTPPTKPTRAPASLSLTRPAPPHARRIGRSGPVVAPLGISGHYGLPVEGFARACEAGVNLVFWEPNYQTLTEFAARLSPADRAALHFLAGTFEADGPRVRRDVERALKALKIDRLSIFLIFWVQSWARVAPDVRETLEALQAEGKVESFGLSTHSRPLAVEALESGWDPVMVRHSAAHPGAEERVLPRVVELGTTVLTFNNTCYGRLLQPCGDVPPTAADCYRYTLAQPGVAACWSAPATLEELEENLQVLREPTLPPERLEQLRAHGQALYQEETTFRKLVRAR